MRAAGDILLLERLLPLMILIIQVVTFWKIGTVQWGRLLY